MVFDCIQSVPWDCADARNHGVTGDRRVMFEGGYKLRIISYTDPRSRESYEVFNYKTARHRRKDWQSRALSQTQRIRDQ